MTGARPAAAVLFLLTHGALAADTAVVYRWPLPAQRIVTSAFGEYRRNHFHAGIDISSGDVAGCAVLASRAGYVARIRVSPTGYGKMLELRHADGFTTAYAHLDRFSPALEERTHAEQVRLERYPVDIACPPEEFPVAQGELIGYTGRTGAASPHLHFEVRDDRGDPVNPFRWPSLRVRDDIPPVIRRIAVVPLGPDATVDGRRAPLAWRSGPRPRTVTVTGSVGIAVAGRDRIPGSRFLCGVYARSLLLDGKEYFTERLDVTPWSEAHEIELCYDHDLPGGGRYARLYVNSPNHLRTYAPPIPRSGIIDASALLPGSHTLRIVLADYAGNAASAELTLIARRDRAAGEAPRGDSPPPPMTIACAGDEAGVGVRVAAAGEFTCVPRVTVDEGGATTAVIMHAAPGGAYEGHFTPRETYRGVRRVRAEAASGGARAFSHAEIDVEPILPFTAGTIALDGGTLLLGYDSLSVLKPLFLCVTKESAEGETFYRLSPESAVLGSGLSVAIRGASAGAHAGLFYRTAGAWQYIGPASAGRIRVRLGDVALLHDSTPPVLLGLRGERTAGGERALTFRFGDDLSGVEYDSLKSYIDGHLVIPEIDGRRHRALAGARERLARGPHELSLRLTDRMGNARTVVRRFVLR